jgi:hypothetical protein
MWGLGGGIAGCDECPLVQEGGTPTRQSTQHTHQLEAKWSQTKRYQLHATRAYTRMRTRRKCIARGSMLQVQARGWHASAVQHSTVPRWPLAAQHEMSRAPLSPCGPSISGCSCFHANVRDVRMQFTPLARTGRFNAARSPSRSPAVHSASSVVVGRTVALSSLTLTLTLTLAPPPLTGSPRVAPDGGCEGIVRSRASRVHSRSSNTHATGDVRHKSRPQCTTPWNANGRKRMWSLGPRKGNVVSDSGNWPSMVTVRYNNHFTISYQGHSKTVCAL